MIFDNLLSFFLINDEQRLAILQYLPTKSEFILVTLFSIFKAGRRVMPLISYISVLSSSPILDKFVIFLSS